MEKIVFSVQYAGLALPVVKNARGVELVPLRPISDLFGLNWPRQRQKILASARYCRMLGATPEVMAHGWATPQLCINRKRISIFLYSLNPTKMRSAGNGRGADLLNQRLIEMGDALHDFIEMGIAINVNHKHAQAEVDALQALRAASGPSPALEQKISAALAELNDLNASTPTSMEI